MISIIIPVLDEEAVLRKNRGYLKELSSYAEIIFVDGGSADDSMSVASGLGRVLRSERGRAVQMNRGAAESKGDILLFLHADCIVTRENLEDASDAIKRGYAGGCFTQRLDNPARVYRFIENTGNRRARRTGIFYGDQAIFVKRRTFFEIGGFPEIDIMEDVIFSGRLKESGKVTVLDRPVYVSARRWERQGLLRTNLNFILIDMLFRIKAPLGFIKRFYADIR
jgi:rSAM/selenodomain-associated transferase 2